MPQVQQNKEALHLFRHLLRQATYLPPVCRDYFEPRLHLAFRRHRNAADPRKYLSKARGEYRNVRAANNGDLERMRKLLLITFGRIGERRHRLMKPITRHPQPRNATRLETQDYEGKNADWLDRLNRDKLLLFARSQSKQSLHNSPRPEVVSKRLSPPKVPDMSAWAQPFGKYVWRSMHFTWWRSLMKRILPPLPRGQWELLQKLATEPPSEEWLPKPRRAPAQKWPPDPSRGTEEDPESIDEWDWEPYATKPIHKAERKRSRRLRVLFPPDGQAPTTPFDGPPIGIHRFSPRVWQRLYADVWQMSAVMEKTPGPDGEWVITWGGVSRIPIPPSESDSEFFEGVDTKGRPLPKEEDVKEEKEGKEEKQEKEEEEKEKEEKVKEAKESLEETVEQTNAESPEAENAGASSEADPSQKKRE